MSSLRTKFGAVPQVILPPVLCKVAALNKFAAFLKAVIALLPSRQIKIAGAPHDTTNKSAWHVAGFAFVQ